VELRCIIILIILAALLPRHSAPETLRGEEKLLARLGPSELQTYYGLQYLLGEADRIAYLSLPTSKERSRWLAEFWLEVDPTPTTDENEARSEHEQRVETARTLFGKVRAPGWDARGEIHIRYGAPSSRTPIDANVTTTGHTLGGELWYYDKLHMSVRFQTINREGNCVYRYAERPPKIPGPPIKGGGGLRNRGPFEPTEPDYMADELTRLMMNKLQPYQIAGLESQKARRAAENFYRCMNRYAAVYSCDTDWETLPLYFDIVSFRGGDWRDRAEVCFEVPAKDLTLEGKGPKLRAEVDLRVRVQDDSLCTVASGEDRMSFVLPADSLARRILLPAQILLALAPGRYHVGIEARDKNSNRRAAFRTEVNLPAFTGEPSISEILFASSIEEAGENRRFVKGSLQVVPHPTRAYRIPSPVLFYFEIYALDADAGGRVFYGVGYRIVPLEKKRWGPVLIETPTTISSSFETNGYGAMQPQRLSIATEELWEGPFRLEVTVTDRRTFRKAERAAQFNIVK